jgi:hypothetical protein
MMLPTVWTCMLVVFAVCSPSHAFVPRSTSPLSIATKLTPDSTPTYPGRSVTSLLERRWNFNEGQGPFGLKKNAEIWNGRVAQVRRCGRCHSNLVLLCALSSQVRQSERFNVSKLFLFLWMHVSVDVLRGCVCSRADHGERCH